MMTARVAQASEQHSPLELERATRAILDKHRGKDLPNIIASLHLELIDRFAMLEQRVNALEERKKR